MTRGIRYAALIFLVGLGSSSLRAEKVALEPVEFQSLSEIDIQAELELQTFQNNSNPRQDYPLFMEWRKEETERELAWSLYLHVREDVAPFPVISIETSLSYNFDQWPSFAQSPIVGTEAGAFQDYYQQTQPTIDGDALQVCSATDYRAWMPALPRGVNNLHSFEAGEHKLFTIFAEPGELSQSYSLNDSSDSNVPIFFHSRVVFNSLWANFSGYAMVNHSPELHEVDLDGNRQENFLDYQAYYNQLNSYPTPTTISLFRCAYDSRKSLPQDGWNHYQHMRELGARINGGDFIADATGDGLVNVFDLQSVVNALGSQLFRPNGGVNPNFRWQQDLNGDERVDYFDLITVMNQMGRNYFDSM